MNRPPLRTIIARFFGSPKGLPYRLIVNKQSFVCFWAILELPLQGHLQLCTFLCRPSIGTLTNPFLLFCESAFWRGCGGTVIFRLRNISVATERCDVFLAKKVSPAISFKQNTQKGKTEIGFSLLFCIYRKPFGAVISSH